MWLTFAIIAVAVVSYAIEKISMELTSLAVVAALLILFYAMPLVPEAGQFGAREILAGFADPALFAILALLVIGQGLVRTGALDNVSNLIVSRAQGRSTMIVVVALTIVAALSAILNNTPVVVMFIPVISALAHRLRRNASLVMMPLSFAAILGGNITLIGSSTNLLVSGTLERTTGAGIGFFDFTIPGLVLAGVGFGYLLFIAPLLLRERADLAAELGAVSGKQFVAQIEVTRESNLAGMRAVSGMFPALRELTIRMIQRGEDALLPPFDETELKDGDILVVAATRATLTKFLKRAPESLRGDAATDTGEDAVTPLRTGREPQMVEAVVGPGSRMIGRTLAQIGFHGVTNCIVLGIQRRSRMIRSAIDKIRLNPGDVLLILGDPKDIMALRASPDVLLLEWSARDVPLRDHSRRALLLFVIVVALAATRLVPIPVAAIAGATLMIVFGCLNLQQATRAIDQRIFLIVGAALAMGGALTATGGAEYVAHSLLNAIHGLPTPIVLSAFFLLVAALTNVLSNNATAVLFTPIAVSAAHNLGMDPFVFVIAVIFAANCSYATPMGYQTNLLVMGPGHYTFGDFLRVGIPLILILWISFTLFVPWYYGLY